MGVFRLLALIILTILPQAIFGQQVPRPPPLVNFQINQPLTLPKDVKTCVVPLLRRNFGNSYYQPEIVQYTYDFFFYYLEFLVINPLPRPPTDCGPIGSWVGISLNWTATSNGVSSWSDHPTSTTPCDFFITDAIRSTKWRHLPKRREWEYQLGEAFC